MTKNVTCPAKCGANDELIELMMWHWRLAHKRGFDKAIRNLRKRELYE